MHVLDLQSPTLLPRADSCIGDLIHTNAQVIKALKGGIGMCCKSIPGKALAGNGAMGSLIVAIFVAPVEVLLPSPFLGAARLQEARRLSPHRLLVVSSRLVESCQIMTNSCAEDTSHACTSNLGGPLTLVLVKAHVDQGAHVLILRLQLPGPEVHGLLDVEGSGLQAKNLEAVSSQKRDERG